MEQFEDGDKIMQNKIPCNNTTFVNLFPLVYTTSFSLYLLECIKEVDVTILTSLFGLEFRVLAVIEQMLRATLFTSMVAEGNCQLQ